MLLGLILICNGLSEVWPSISERKSLLVDFEAFQGEPVKWSDRPLCTSGTGNYQGEWVRYEEAKLRYGTQNLGTYCVECVAKFSPLSVAELLNITTEALKWRWEPRKCRYSQLSPELFIRRMLGKRLLLIGDSIMGELSKSIGLTIGCSFRTIRNTKCEEWVSQIYEERKTVQELSSFASTSVSVENYCNIISLICGRNDKTDFVQIDFWRSDRLGVEAWINDFMLGDNQHRLLRLYSAVLMNNSYDVILFETGPHWNPEDKNHILLHSGLDIHSILEKFSSKVSNAFANLFHDSTLIFMPMWLSNWNCVDVVKPLKFMRQYWAKRSNWDKYNTIYVHDINSMWINAWEDVNQTLHILDTVALSLNPLGRVGLNINNSTDCAHSLLPGIYDLIGDWLWTLLLSIIPN